MNVNRLKEILLKAWCKETATGGIWDENNPSLNQCAITALVVQDFLGGELERCNTEKGDSHYWNRFSFTDIDLTKDQFNYIDDKPNYSSSQPVERQYILSYPNTMKRYGILLQRIAEQEW